MFKKKYCAPWNGMQQGEARWLDDSDCPSHLTTLDSSTFIDFWIFFDGLRSYWLKDLILLPKLSNLFLCQNFQRLRLFTGLCLFWTLGYHKVRCCRISLNPLYLAATVLGLKLTWFRLNLEREIQNFKSVIGSDQRDSREMLWKWLLHTAQCS